MALAYYWNQPGWREQLRMWRYWPNLLPPIHQMTATAFAGHLSNGAFLALMALAGWGLGRPILRRSGAGEVGGMAGGLLALGVGWGALGLAFLGLGLAGFWRVWVVWALLMAGWGGALREAHRWLGERPSAPAGGPAAAAWTAWEGGLVLFLGCLGALHFFAALMPETFYDSLVYHLALPDRYWRRGGIVPTFENLYSGFPMLTSMLYGLALPLGSDGLARLMHWALGAAAVACVYELGRRCAGRSSGLLAAALFYAVPMTGALTWQCGAEMGWAFFQLLALLALVIRVERGEAPGPWIFWCGVFAGLAMGSKYQAGPLLGVLPAALYAARPTEGRALRRECLVLAAVALAVVSPWLLKNAVLYSNPVYPFFHESFADEPIPRWRQLVADAERRDLARVLSTGAGFKSFLLHPWEMSYQGTERGPTFLMALPVLGLAAFRSGGLSAVWIAALGLWAAWSLSTTMFRYFIPTLPVICVAAAAAWESLLGPRARPAMRVLLILHLMLQGEFIFYWLKSSGVVPVILGIETLDRHLSVPHPFYHNPVQPAVAFINRELPAAAKVLFVGEARCYHLRRDGICTTYYDDFPVRPWLARSPDAAAFREILRDNGVTHVLFNRNELGRWQGRGRHYLQLKSRETQVWQDFMRRYPRKIFDQQGPRRDGMPVSDNVVYELSG